MTPELVEFKQLGDDRGNLIAVESGRSVPFTIERAYYIYNTAAGVERGFHAHKALTQVAVAVAGSCEMVLDDGDQEVAVLLDSPIRGLLIRPGCWRVMKNFSSDCVLLVFADAHYDESDYIRDYGEFKQWLKER